MNAGLRRAGHAAAAVLVLALLASCGKKTDPLTPDSPRPAAVTDIKVAVRDAVAYLSWPVPAKNAEGKGMDPAEIKAFRVYRADGGRDRKRPLFRQVAEISMADPVPAEVRNGIVSWSDAGLQYGRVYVYRVRAYSIRGGVSGYSDDVRAAPLLSLSPPKNVAAEAGDTVVTLTWDAVTAKSDGSLHQGFVGYVVYRGTEPGKYDETPLNREPLTAGAYRDATTANDRKYFYRVRTVDSPVKPWQESLDSTEASATPRDSTPPVPPKNITVVPGIGRVFLTWSENDERDLAGYHVYRSKKSGADYERLTANPVNRTTFSDDTVRQGETYYYVIVAVDKSGNESSRSKEQKTYTEKLR